MTAKCLILGVISWGTMVAAPAAMATSIYLNQNAYSFGNAGEFTAQASPQDFLGGYVPVTIVNGGFETFCVQASVTYCPGTTYSFTLSNTDSQGRVLTEGAAFLYYEFAKGLLAGYDYNDAANRRIDAGEFQAAIWKLQGDQTGDGSFPNGGAGNPFYDLAITNLGINHLTAANNGLYSVQILQLWDQAGTAHQNQLVVTVPEPGFSPALLAMGLAGLYVAGVRTRRLQPAPVRSR